MKKYFCTRCEFTTDRKSTLTDHLNRIRPCKGSLPAELGISSKFKETPHNSNTTINNIDNSVDNSVDNRVNNITINIMVNSVGNPSVDHIPENNIENILKARLPLFFKSLYFDEAVPENHSILYTEEDERKGVIRVVLGDEPIKKFTPIGIKRFYNDIATDINLAQNRIIDKLPEEERSEMYRKATNIHNKRSATQIVADNEELLEIAKKYNTIVDV